MKKGRLLYQYLNYLFTSVNERHVHSPFVYDLLTNVVYVKEEYYAFKTIEKLRGQLLSSDAAITYTDYGASGTSAGKSTKKISRLAKNVAKSPKYGQLLFRLVNHFQPSFVLELGTSLGISTAYMASANTQAKVVTIEGSKELSEIAGKHFRRLKINNIEQIQGNFDDELPKVLDGKGGLPDFVFFDGNHRKEPTLNYFQWCLQKADENSVFVFDDIHWSDEMSEAWEEIKKHHKVSLTIDLFFMGLVFFKREEGKQHFVIRL